MALVTDSETLTKELKMAVKMGRNFILSLGTKPADGYLALSKKVIPKSEDVTARKQTKKKVFRGRCFKDGTMFVFETDKKVSPAMSLKLKLLIKEQTAFKMKQIELRQAAGLGVVAEPEPGAEEAEEEDAQAAGSAGAVQEDEPDTSAASDATATEEEEEAQASSARGGAATQDEEPAETRAPDPADTPASGETNPFSGEPAQTKQAREAPAQPDAEGEPDMVFTEREVYGDGEGPDMVFTEAETRGDGESNPFEQDAPPADSTGEPDMVVTEREVYGDGEGPDMEFTDREVYGDEPGDGESNPFEQDAPPADSTGEPDMVFTEREVHGDGEGPDMVFTEREVYGDEPGDAPAGAPGEGESNPFETATPQGQEGQEAPQGGAGGEQPSSGPQGGEEPGSGPGEQAPQEPSSGTSMSPERKAEIFRSVDDIERELQELLAELGASA